MRKKSGPLTPEMGYEVHVASTERALEELENEWSALQRQSRNRSPFSSFAWLQSWWMEIGRCTDGNELRVIAIRRGDHLVGIAPFYVAMHPLGTRVLRNLGDTLVGSEYLDVLCADAHAEWVLDAIETAVQAAGDVDALMLIDLAEDGLLAEVFSRHAHLSVGRRLTHSETLPIVKLGGSKQSFTRSLSKNMRYNLQRKEKKLLARFPGARLGLVESEAQLQESLETLFRLHTLRWRSKGQSGNFADPRVRAFHASVCPHLLRDGVLRMYRLDLEDQRPGALLYCLREDKRELYLQAGMDPELEDLSAGFCLLKWVIEGCAEEGLEEFDMLRGTEDYKRHWTREARRTSSLELALPTLRGRLWITARNARQDGVGFLKRHLPPEIVRELRRLRGSAARSPEREAAG
jgi:CelD/BcsL family acetyltransferase involved in cellulose biosynthesis